MKTGGFIWWPEHVSRPGAAQVVPDSPIGDEPLFVGAKGKDGFVLPEWSARWEALYQDGGGEGRGSGHTRKNQFLNFCPSWVTLSR